MTFNCRKFAREVEKVAARIEDGTLAPRHSRVEGLEGGEHGLHVGGHGGRGVGSGGGGAVMRGAGCRPVTLWVDRKIINCGRL